MDINKLLLNKPADDKSLSASLVVLSSAIMTVGIGLEMFGIIKSTSVSMEFFGICCGLYFGRRYTGTKGQVLEGESK